LSEFEPAPKDFRPLITEQLESSPEVPETPVVALEKMRMRTITVMTVIHPLIYGAPWSIATDRT
jgi:hypothetical protein